MTVSWPCKRCPGGVQEKADGTHQTGGEFSGRAVHAIGEQVRVLRRGLHRRLGPKVSWKHTMMAWLVEHAADVLSTYQFGDLGRTAYERLDGKKCKQETVEFSEWVHYGHNLKEKSKDEQLEVKWGEEFFLGNGGVLKQL